MSQEKTYYQHDQITVTNARAMLGGKTYAMANVTSVALTKKSPNRLWNLFLGFFALAFAATGLILGIADGTWGLFLFSLVILGLAVVWWIAAKTQYYVTLGSASGEMHALASTDETYIRKIVEAMSTAIVERG